MRCSECGTDNAPDGNYCTTCGVVLEVACSSCGRGCHPEARFCGWCGAARIASALAIEPRGERKQATILFADIVDSTKLIAGGDAESGIGLLHPVIAAMEHAVKRFDGTVLGILGDGLIAAFGAPRSREGHALLACQAALAMRDDVAALPNPTMIRIGLHSGEVITGTLDIRSSVQIQAQGMTLHIASRVENAAEPGDICLTPECRVLVGAYCDTVSIGVRQLKGVPAAVELFRLIGLKPAIASDQFRNGDLTRLRGRERELETLKNALLDVARGEANAIGITAPPGVGKSRLCYEFGEWCRQRRIEVLEARAHVFGRATPLLPVLEMLRAFFRITPALEPTEARQGIETKLIALDPSLAVDLPLLADFLGLPAPDPAGQGIDPKTRRTRLRDLIRRMVKAAGRRPSVIIFEDLQWLDDPSYDFVETMVEAVQGTKMVMVLNYRSIWSCPWVALPHYQELSLAELPEGDIDDLVHDLIGDDATLDGLIPHVAQQCGGNPFFAEEIVRALVQRGVLIGERGRYQMATAADWRDQALPATLEALISARLDLLREGDKAILQIGAVIGKEYPLTLVQAVAGMVETETKEILDRLCEMELIRPCTTVHGPSFAFLHPLLHEVAYAMQLRTRRTKLHAEVARAIEGSAWGRLDESSALLAHHCEVAGQALEAAMHLRRAALWVGRTNSTQAMANWKKIRWLLRDVPRSETSDELRALASGRVLGYSWMEGLTAEDVKPYAEEALSFAREAGDQRHEALLMGAYGRVFAASDASDDYIGLVRQGVAIAEASDDPDVVVACNAQASQAYLFSGLLREGLSANDAALAVIEAQSRRRNDGIVLGLNPSQIFGFDVPQWLRCLRVRLLVFLDRFEEAEASIQAALDADRGNMAAVVQYLVHVGAVDLAWHRGDARTADRHTDEVARYADQTGVPYLHVAALTCRGLAKSADGDFGSAARCFDEALATARRSRTGLENEAKLLAFLADTSHRAGNFALAATIAAETIVVARRRTDRLAELHASIIAALASLAGDGDDAGRRSVAAAQVGHAEHLLGMTGGGFFKPLLSRAKAALDATKPIATRLA